MSEVCAIIDTADTFANDHIWQHIMMLKTLVAILLQFDELFHENFD